MTINEFKCFICGTSYKDRRSFGVHFNHAHKKEISRAEYAKRFSTDEWVKCEQCDTYHFRTIKDQNQKRNRICGSENCIVSDRKCKYKNSSACMKKRHQENDPTLGNPKEVINNLRKTNYKKYLELYKKVSNSVSNFIEQNGIPYRHVKTSFLKNKWTGENEYMASSWERKFAEFLVTMNVQYKKKHGIRIHYIKSNGLSSTYTPDFLLEHSREIVEVKGYEDENSLIKKEVCKKWCRDNNYEYILLKEKELTDLGINLKRRNN
jgi:hypothetical protein